MKRVVKIFVTLVASTLVIGACASKNSSTAAAVKSATASDARNSLIALSDYHRDLTAVSKEGTSPSVYARELAKFISTTSKTEGYGTDDVEVSLDDIRYFKQFFALTSTYLKSQSASARNVDFMRNVQSALVGLGMNATNSYWIASAMDVWAKEEDQRLGHEVFEVEQAVVELPAQ